MSGASSALSGRGSGFDSAGSPAGPPGQVEAALDLVSLVEQIESQAARIESLEGEVEDAVGERTRLIERAKRTWEATFDAIVDPLALVQADLRVRRANQAWATQAEVDVRQVPGQRCHEALFGRPEPCSECPIQRAGTAGRRGGRGEVSGGGRVFRVWSYPIALDGEPTGLSVCQYKDVTADKALERKLAHAGRMSAVGQFAAGVAHEISNPISAILAFAQLLKRNLDAAQGGHEYVEEIEQSAQRCSQILRGLLDFSRPSPQGHLPLDLRQVASRALVLVGHGLKPPTYRIERIEPPAPIRVLGNALELEGVVVNLLVNARAAMTGGGRIAIRLELAPDEAPTYARLAVEDDGPGMDEVVRSRAFEPFFTTKPEGQGTGLGLSLSRDVVEAHGGWMELESALGQGTSVRLCLPLHDR